LLTEAQEPQTRINPEQTASLLSWAFYIFLDPLIFKARRVPHLSIDEFPPMADYDYAKNLIARSYKYMDRFTNGGKEHKSPFLALVLVFRASLVQQSLWLVGYVSGEIDDFSAALTHRMRSLWVSSQAHLAPSGCSGKHRMPSSLVVL
jgi:hypothetical protein